MKKEQLLDFINRYYLNGKIETVMWDIEDSNVKTLFISGDRSLLGIVNNNNFNLHKENVKLGVLTTSNLIKMISPMPEEFEYGLDVVDVKGEKKVISMTLTDTSTFNKDSAVGSFMLADLSVLTPVKGLKGQPNYNISVLLNFEWITYFLKVKSALSDSHSFTIVRDDKTNKYYLVIGYSSVNSNRYKLPIDVEVLTEDLTEPISFSAEYFKEILNVNKNADEMTFKVSNEGISHVHVKDGDFENDYYLSETETDI